MDFPRIKHILLKILLLNWLVAFAKIYVGLWSGSLSILADGLHSFFDGSSNIIGWFGVKLAERPKDFDHPYGHRKYEAFASLGILFLLALTIYEFGKSIVEKFFRPAAPEINLIIIAVLFGALGIDWLVAKYEYGEGRKLKSTILIADSLHTRSHIFTTSAVIIGAIGTKLGFPILDPLVAIFVLAMLGKLAYSIFNETSPILCDQAFIDTGKIQNIVKNFPEIRVAHQIRTRGDSSHIFLDMHISFDPNMALEKAHGISHDLKNKIQQEIPEIQDVVIHIEPER